MGSRFSIDVAPQDLVGDSQILYFELRLRFRVSTLRFRGMDSGKNADRRSHNNAHYS